MYLGNTDERTIFSSEIINGRNVRQHSYFDHEDEILLLPGTSKGEQTDFNYAKSFEIIEIT
jgi:hypothetical protein